ncbi:helix-turn-helix transcriptional regulator [Streptomyces sp. NPDC059701]|uniref:helix-turn-helix transcriptional regulator n=1 Tax=Streptomyces sp. NPDC059701 TaxID=3346914 RepID=UPI0036976E62
MPRTPTFNQPPPPGHVWADGASRLTGRSIETLYKDRQKQKRTGRSDGPRSVDIGRKAAWRITDIDAWLAGQNGPAPDTEALYNSRPPEPVAA